MIFRGFDEKEEKEEEEKEDYNWYY